MRSSFRFAAIVLAAWVSGGALAQDGGPATRDDVTARELVVERPTLIALGFEWYVGGDDDGDATVTVSYRAAGTAGWREAQPLLRINREDRSASYGPTAEWQDRPNLFAGSIFDLEPETAYEIRLVMADPDGARGEVERIVAASTRAETRPAPDGRVFHVYPPDHQGPVEDPAFIGLLAAYYDGPAITADHYNVYPPRVRAGDTILVHGGVYRDNWHNYVSPSVALPPGGEWPANPTCCGATFHGTYILTADGTAERPIAIIAAGDGEVVFDGDGNDTLFNLVGGDHHYFEGISFRNTKVAIQAGWKGVAGSSGLTVRRSRFEDVGIGIHTDWSGAQDFTVLDNVFIGRNDPGLLSPFAIGYAGASNARFVEEGLTVEDTALRSEYAVKVYGAGHVVAHNRVENFHDGIDHATYGVPDGWPDVPRERLPAANDFYNNLISNMHDDCIEVDGMLYNARVLRNLCVNAVGSAISTQGPALSGPIYLVRNIVYHAPGLFAGIKTFGASGLRVYNNTFAVAIRGRGASDNADFRNNLILAELPDEPAYRFVRRDGSPASDFNGFMAGSDAGAAFVALAEGAGQGRGGSPRDGEATSFSSLADWTRATGQDRNSRMVDYGVFAALAAPGERIRQVYDPATLDFRLSSAGAAVDAGTPVANVTDGYDGRAPDLGAIELGAAPPVYGPRPESD